MSRYIDADRLKQMRDDVISGKLDIENESDLIDACPTEDVVAVVRCKDYKHYKDWTDGTITCSLWTVDWDVSTEPNAFCSYGKKKTD